MQIKNVEIKNAVGLHARPAALMIEQAKRFKSQIRLTKNGETAALNSLISLLRLRVKCGDIVTLQTDGEDEQEAMADLVQLIEDKFHED